MIGFHSSIRSFLKKYIFHYFQVLIVITDGKQTTAKAYTELSVASQGVKNKGVAVYAVGVGKGADAAELMEIASSQGNVFVSASFKELQPLAVEIRKRLCDCKFLTLVNKKKFVPVRFIVTVKTHFSTKWSSKSMKFAPLTNSFFAKQGSSCLTKYLLFTCIFLSVC